MVAQWQCMPLQAVNMLVHLSEGHLLCDDEVAVSVQVDGVMLVLSSLVGEKKTVSFCSQISDFLIVMFTGEQDFSRYLAEKSM